MKCRRGVRQAASRQLRARDSSLNPFLLQKVAKQLSFALSPRFVGQSRLVVCLAGNERIELLDQRVLVQPCQHPDDIDRFMERQ